MVALLLWGARSCLAFHAPLVAAGGAAPSLRSHPSAMRPARTSEISLAGLDSAGLLLDEWFRTAPYQSAFCVTAFKATLADFITQIRERLALQEAIKSAEDDRFASDGESKYLLIDSLVSCDDVSCEEIKVAQPATKAVQPMVRVAKTTTIVESDEISFFSSNEVSFPSKLVVCDDEQCVEMEAEPPGLSVPRLGTFFLYGGLYQGCVQYFIFNELYPIWFGEGTDIGTIAVKVCFDQFVLTPFICLPVCYLVKALVFSYPLRDGLERYIADAKRDLLIKYWVLWGPVQCLTFGVVPPQWRVPFIALVSFFWLLILSSITARAEAAEAAEAQASSSPVAS
jgi:hypothetical protein